MLEIGLYELLPALGIEKPGRPATHLECLIDLAILRPESTLSINRLAKRWGRSRNFVRGILKVAERQNPASTRQLAQTLMDIRRHTQVDTKQTELSTENAPFSDSSGRDSDSQRDILEDRCRSVSKSTFHKDTQRHIENKGRSAANTGVVSSRSQIMGCKMDNCGSLLRENSQSGTQLDIFETARRAETKGVLEARSPKAGQPGGQALACAPTRARAEEISSLPNSYSCKKEDLLSETKAGALAADTNLLKDEDVFDWMPVIGVEKNNAAARRKGVRYNEEERTYELPVLDSKVRQWEQVWEGVDIRKLVRKACQYRRDKREKRPTIRGAIAAINRYLTWTVDKGYEVAQPVVSATTSPANYNLPTSRAELASLGEEIINSKAWQANLLASGWKGVFKDWFLPLGYVRQQDGKVQVGKDKWESLPL